MKRNGMLGLLAMACAVATLPSAVAAQAAQDYEEPVIRDEPGKTEPKFGVAEEGKQVATKLCMACHLIGEESQAAAAADVPSFRGIANRPDQSIQKLTAWLIEPHTPMPNIHLTRKEIRDLAAYILSLRTEK